MSLGSENCGNKTIDAVIPVFRPDETFALLLKRLSAQTVPVRKIILMVTRDPGNALPDLNGLPVEVREFEPREFDHGATRNAGAACSDADYLLFMTQDAVPEDGTLIEELLSGFETEGVAAVYARQIPASDASPIEKLTRNFNYPDQDRVQDLSMKPELGIKTFFCSNVAALYDRFVFDSLGGFVNRTIFNEDMIFAYSLVQAGYKVLYKASAHVIHSHHYTGPQQFRRNFDLGVSQADHPEIFGAVSSEKEGSSMVKTVIRGLFKGGKGYLVFQFLYQCVMKYLGYRAGKRYRKLPERKVRKYSLNQHYWESYYGTDSGHTL